MNDEFVYAEPTTCTSAGVSIVSTISSVPSSGLRRRLSRASLVTRILSTVGLKSNPLLTPVRIDGLVSKLLPSGTAIAVLGLSRYTTLSLPSAYRSPEAGRKSMPRIETPSRQAGDLLRPQAARVVGR